jgi:GTPase
MFPPQVRSIECRRTPITEAKKGTSCTFAVRAVNRKITLRKNAFRKGKILKFYSAGLYCDGVEFFDH